MRCMPLATEGGDFDLDDEINGAHIDAEFQGRRGAKRTNLAGLQLLLDHRALVGGKGTVVGAGNGFTGKVVESAGKPLGDLTAVHKKDGRVALANKFEQARVNGVPDRYSTRHLRGGP